MTSVVLSIFAFALLFVALGFVRRENGRASRSDRRPEQDKPSACDSCPLPRNLRESKNHIKLVR